MKFKQLVMSGGMLLFVAAVVAGGTGAFFSDTETSAGNVFTAGSVALAIDNIAHNYTGGGQGDDVPTFTLTPDEQNPAAFELDDIKPLDSGDITYTLENQDNSIHLCVLVEDANDDPTAADSALLSMMDFMFEGQAGSVSSAAGVWQSLGTMDAGPTTEDFGVSYCFGTYDDETCVLDTDATYNDAQGGQLMLNLEFYAVQTRNNDDFECDSLNEDTTEIVYFQGFENPDLSEEAMDWFHFPNDVGTFNRSVPSGTEGINASEGNAFASLVDNAGAFTRWGGYSTEFPTGGWTAEIDVFLDMAEADGSDKRIDYIVAANRPDDTHLRDFDFHLGTNPDVAGQWAVSVSNNAPGWPLNPSANPIDITTTGWYTLQAYFYDDSGVLAVEMNVIDSDGTVLGSWVLSNTDDEIPAVVGGNRYGWFLNNGFDFFAFDNAKLYLGAPNN